MNQFRTYNPADESFINEWTFHSDKEVEEIIKLGQNAYESNQALTFEEKKSLMQRAADILERRKLALADLITTEMGKVNSEAIAEVEKCAWVCRYYAENSETFLADEYIETEAYRSFVAYRPLGVVLAVMPWNYPFWQVFRFAAPALMAGNVGILKHASNVPGCATAIEEVFLEAGFRRGSFQTLLIKSSQVASILKNPIVKAATLTGSGPAGQSVAAEAGQNIKKTVLELGGSDPYIVLEDADLDLAADHCCKSRLLNAGQSCIGAKRFIIVEKIYDEWLMKFTQKMKEATMGNPFQAHTIGPMARKDLRDEVHQQVVDSIAGGAELILGGYIPEGEGSFYPPTLIVNVKKGTPAYDDEIFGPVASVIKVRDEEEAIKIANDTKFGLGACVFTEDKEKGEFIAKYKLNAGSCFVNQFVKSDPRLPFGGIGESGYGRELSHHGIREFTNTKSVYVAD